jgi:hypothetical protein
MAYDIMVVSAHPDDAADLVASWPWDRPGAAFDKAKVYLDFHCAECGAKLSLNDLAVVLEMVAWRRWPCATLPCMSVAASARSARRCATILPRLTPALAALSTGILISMASWGCWQSTEPLSTRAAISPASTAGHRPPREAISPADCYSFSFMTPLLLYPWAEGERSAYQAIVEIV